MKNESDKMLYVSVLRICSMLLIVLYHSLCFYSGVWWYLRTNVVPVWKIIASPVETVGLTSFFLISGFLYGQGYIEKGKYKKIVPFLGNKIRRLLIPYFFWGILMIITMPVVHISWINLLTGVAHLWFLMALFEMFVLMMLFNRFGINEYSSIIVDFLILVLSFALLYIWKALPNCQYVLAITVMLYYWPAFLMGFYYAKYGQNRYCKVVFSSLLVIGIIVLFVISFVGYPDNCVLYRLPAIVVSLSAMTLVKKSSVSLYQSNLLNNLDKNSMGIYIFNQIIVFIILLNSESNHFLSCHPYLGVLILFVVSLVIPWLLSYLFNKTKSLSLCIG